MYYRYLLELSILSPVVVDLKPSLVAILLKSFVSRISLFINRKLISYRNYKRGSTVNCYLRWKTVDLLMVPIPEYYEMSLNLFYCRICFHCLWNITRKTNITQSWVDTRFYCFNINISNSDCQILFCIKHSKVWSLFLLKSQSRVESSLQRISWIFWRDCETVSNYLGRVNNVPDTKTARTGA